MGALGPPIRAGCHEMAGPSGTLELPRRVPGEARGSLRSAADTELGEDPADEVAYGPLGQVQDLADLAVRLALSDELQDLPLPVGQGVLGRIPVRLEPRENHARDGGVQQRGA